MKATRLAETPAVGSIQLEGNLILTIASLSSIVLASFHFADDVVRGFEPGGPKNIRAVLILVVWLYGTLVLAGKRSGYIVILLGSILGTLMCYSHMRYAGLVGGRIAGSSGMFFWVWTLLALGITSAFSVLLAVRGLFGRRRALERPEPGSD
jgi:hypothetical protein